MLPPFVPPSARVPSESLPLITEFVIDRSAHAETTMTATAPSTSTDGTSPRTWTSEDFGALPSIDDFLMEKPAPAAAAAHAEPVGAAGAETPAANAPTGEAARPAPAHAEENAPQPTVEAARPSEGSSEGTPPVELERAEAEVVPAAPSEIALTAMSADASEVHESVPPGARFNDEAGDTMAEAPLMTASEAWEASAAASGVPGDETAHASAEQSHDEWGGEDAGEATSETDVAWVAEERDAYDWQSVGTIAAGTDEARRAAEAWEGTEWEPRRSPEHDQIATALVQLARRVRAGELKVDVPPNATVEASLAALLAALLSDGSR